jgi:hypothetical protein
MNSTKKQKSSLQKSNKTTVSAKPSTRLRASHSRSHSTQNPRQKKPKSTQNQPSNLPFPSKSSSFKDSTHLSQNDIISTPTSELQAQLTKLISIPQPPQQDPRLAFRPLPQRLTSAQESWQEMPVEMNKQSSSHTLSTLKQPQLPEQSPNKPKLSQQITQVQYYHDVLRLTHNIQMFDTLALLSQHKFNPKKHSQLNMHYLVNIDPVQIPALLEVLHESPLVADAMDCIEEADQAKEVIMSSQKQLDLMQSLHSLRKIRVGGDDGDLV